MRITVKTGAYIAGILCLLSAVVFLYFNSADEQKVILESSDTANVVSPQAASSGELQTGTEKVSEAKKTLPFILPLLMYHYIREYAHPSDPIGENLSVSPKKFEEQITWLKENGYQSVPPSFLETPEPVSFKPIVLTFDDGYQDAYDAAFPVLKKYDMTGMFYLIVDKIGTPGYLTWDEIADMRTMGMSFGSHTLSHPDLRNLSKSNVEKELRGSKMILEQKLGTEVKDFCFPSGKYNDAVLEVVRASGYKTAVTTDGGISTLKSNPYLLPRVRMTQKINIQGLFSR